MFSYSDLLGHKCEHCVNKRCGFKYPVDRSSVGDRSELSHDGCLWYALAKACLDWIVVRSQVQTLNVTLWKTGEFMMFYPAEARSGGFVWEKFECLLKSSDNPTMITQLNGEGEFSLITGKTSSNATFDTIRTWIGECSSGHSKCRSGTTRRMDKLEGIRFLRIGNNSVALTEDVEPDRYACLSHCWGNAENLIRTTTHNRSEHIKTGVEIESLPETYRDALVVCKELDIHYIWIDSLCIVQDDDCDWRGQASRMADIYILAYVTIAAVEAEDASQGLFNSSPESRIGSHLPDYPWAHVRQQLDPPGRYASELNWLKQMKGGEALYKRGWTFQELNLSRRVLHFGAQEVTWSCREVTVSEGEPKGTLALPEHIAINMSRYNSSLQALWYRIVGGYSWRNLTFEKDKFPAIAAFASQVQTMNSGKRYVAGLWEDTLLFDLLWYCSRHGPDYESPYPIEPGIIPSWSWASAKRPVYWLEPERGLWQYVPCTEVVQITYNTRGPPLLGDIVEASLVLRAPIIKLYKDHCEELKNYWKGVEGVSDRVTALVANFWDDHDLDKAEQARDQVGSHHNTLLPPILAIPLTAPKFGEGHTQGYNALIVAMESPGVYRRAGVGRLGLLEEFLDVSRKIQIETLDEGKRSSDQRDHEFAPLDEKKNQRRKKWKGRFMDEMSRLERQIFKLV